MILAAEVFFARCERSWFSSAFIRFRRDEPPSLLFGNLIFHQFLRPFAGIVFTLSWGGSVCYRFGVCANRPKNETPAKWPAPAADKLQAVTPALASRRAGAALERDAARERRADRDLLPCGRPRVPTAQDYSLWFLRHRLGHAGLGR